MPDYAAFLLVPFGGREGPADVMPFLENVTRGRGVPRDRLAEVARHYDAFGGGSPINPACRDPRPPVGEKFPAGRPAPPPYPGDRDMHPHLPATRPPLA